MSKRRKIWAVSTVLIILVAIVAGRILLSKLNQPISGIIKTSASPTKTGYNINLTPKKITGKYLSFNYPSGLTQKTAAPLTAPYVETFNFSAADVTSWVMAVNVSMPPGASLGGDSGFTYRKKNPATYQESQTTVNGQPVDIMTDTTVNFGKVAYILHGNLLATVSLYGDDAQGTQPLQTSFMMVISSLHWL